MNILHQQIEQALRRTDNMLMHACMEINRLLISHPSLYTSIASTSPCMPPMSPIALASSSPSEGYPLLHTHLKQKLLIINQQRNNLNFMILPYVHCIYVRTQTKNNATSMHACMNEIVIKEVYIYIYRRTR